MPWNLHHYYTNRKDGLIGKLLLTEEETDKLKALRKKVRIRTKEVFKEAKVIASDARTASLSQESVLARLSESKIRYLSEDDQRKAAALLHDMDDEARDEFLGLSPRFWTQGSFQYNTLNRPFQSPQEMDIDDGTYLPMTVFESEPRIGHTLLLLLVDSSLKSLAEENQGWVFEAKQTCGRIKIAHQRVHIDVPMYAIPKDQFLKKQLAIEEAALKRAKHEAFDMAIASAEFRDSYEVDPESVNLALREGPERWTNSDPKIVEDWFVGHCSRIGKHLPKVCRFMKAWRDAQWDVGGPSSISLMAASVNILNTVAVDKEDLGATMKAIAFHLPTQFANGIESPDSTDDKPLFPPCTEHGPWELAIMENLRQLHGTLHRAEEAQSKAEALRIINTAYGNRVTDIDLIVQTSAAAAFVQEPDIAEKPHKISSTMSSG